MESDNTLVEAALSTAEAENYVGYFEKFGIDQSVLPELEEADLVHIGVQEESVRRQIINFAQSLPQKESLSPQVDVKFVRDVLKDSSAHLISLNALMWSVLARKEIVSDDVELRHSTQCLIQGIKRLNGNLVQLRRKIDPKQNKLQKLGYVMGIIVSASAAYFVLKKLS